MAKIVSLEQRKTEELAAVLERHMAPLAPMGSLQVPVAKVPDVERWRRAARLAARRLGWRVRTGVSRGYVWLVDIREPPPEVLEAHSREVMDRLDRLINETEAASHRPRPRPYQHHRF